MDFASMNWQPFYLTAKLAFFTTLCLLPIGIVLTKWMIRSRIKLLLETLISLPLVLPPSVLGFYLLLAMSPHFSLGRWLLEQWNLQLLFTFEGLVIGSILYSLPFMVQPIRIAYTAIPKNLLEASKTFGKSTLTTFFRIEIPLIRSGLLVGSIMAFAHTVGEFGLVLMIGGALPGITNVISIAIYHEVEMNNYAQANLYAFILVTFCFTLLFILNYCNRRYQFFNS